jgi:hypothetical protein
MAGLKSRPPGFVLLFFRASVLPWRVLPLRRSVFPCFRGVLTLRRHRSAFPCFRGVL